MAWAPLADKGMIALGRWRRRLGRTARGGSLRGDPLRYADLPPQRRALFARVRPYTQTSLDRVTTLADAVEYVVAANVPGDFVECGVWRGGSSMAIALTLLDQGAQNRRIWMYDTFGEMPAPGSEDRDYTGREVTGHETSMLGETGLSLADVRAAMRSTDYPEERITYIRGLVAETIPGTVPAQIALLRLDTDWYESTRHELVHLYPRLVRGGVLIIDDYGHYSGARQAVDEYFAGSPILLARVDYTGRMAVKP
jgi:O-methyltransferase